jgi:D-alanine transaminase
MFVCKLEEIKMMYYKNRFIDKSEVSISPDDRGYYFGDGVYEVFRIYQGRVYEKEAHLQRLSRSAKEVGIQLPETIEGIDQIVHKLIQMEGISSGTLYLQITRGESPRSHPFPQSDIPAVMMAYCTEVQRPITSMQNGISAITLDDIRWLRCDIKTLNLLPNVLAKQTAVKNGVGEVILHRNGTVTECSASNIMIIQSGVLFTHPANNLILHGITRAVILRLAEAVGIEIKEQAFTVQQLMQADEAFLTGTTMEITPIIEIDGKKVSNGSPGPITQRLQMEFEQTLTL